mgnify:CR=1 FL=1
MVKNQSKSLGINAALNAIRSGLSVIFPLITYPYAFRILHAENIGRVNYALSIIGYFSLIAALGISTYAVREGAKLRNEKVRLNKFCNQIFTINIVTSIISYILLLFCICNIKALGEYKQLILLLSLSVGFSTLGVEWINTIYEDFLYVTVRSIVIYILTLVLLFILVRDQNDVLQYALLSVANSGLICISNWFYCKRYIRVRLTKKLEIKKHIKPVLTIFANSVATTIYVNADITMLGLFSGDYYVGLYSIAVKIYNVIKTMLAAVYSVAVPRISFFIGQNDKSKVKQVFTSVCTALTIILLPAGVGLATISREVVIVMGGTEYLDSVLTLQILSFSLIGAIFGGMFTYCLNIPLGREKVNVKATTISAMVNIGLNMVMIPIFKQNGAALTTAVAEFFVLIYCCFSCKDIEEYLDIKAFKSDLLQSLIGCVIIIIVSSIVKYYWKGVLLRIVLVISLSVMLYGLELVLLKNELMLQLLEKLRNLNKLK